MSLNQKMALNTIKDDVEVEVKGSEDFSKDSKDNHHLQERLAGAIHVVEIEKDKHERAKQTNQKLQAQVETLNNEAHQSRQQIHYLTSSNLVLAQEVLKLRAGVETLQATIYSLCKT
jgi:hypothetical protein